MAVTTVYATIIIDLMDVGARRMVVLANGHHVMRIPVDTLFRRANLRRTSTRTGGEAEGKGYRGT